jgi:putative restriction endonuclease
MWIQGPNDWSFNLPSGKYYDTTNGEGKRIFTESMEQVPKQDSFRSAVEQAYQQCAVTKEHSIPALEAAHIKPYSLGGFHEAELVNRNETNILFN